MHPFGARCFLTDYWTFNDPTVIKSLCTFWRSVRSDRVPSMGAGVPKATGLNAPYGARCFLTSGRVTYREKIEQS